MAAAANWNHPCELWRTSHLGGHRFAPNALILPEGTMWGFLDEETLHGIVSRTLEPSVAASHYRGSTLLDDRRLQIADAVALANFGWEWFDGVRSGEVLAHDDMSALVSVINGAHRLTVRLVVDGSVPIPRCGAMPDASTECEARYRVESSSDRRALRHAVLGGRP